MMMSFGRLRSASVAFFFESAKWIEKSEWSHQKSKLRESDVRSAPEKRVRLLQGERDPLLRSKENPIDSLELSSLRNQSFQSTIIVVVTPVWFQFCCPRTPLPILWLLLDDSSLPRGKSNNLTVSQNTTTMTWTTTGSGSASDPYLRLAWHFQTFIWKKIHFYPFLRK